MTWSKIVQKGLYYGYKKAGNTALKKMSDTYRNLHDEIFDIKPLNQGEDENIRQMIWDNDPMNKNIEEWDDDDAISVFHSYDYQYNQNKQTKFNEYLNYRGYKQGY